MKKWLMANKVVITSTAIAALTASYSLLIKPDFDFNKDWLGLAWAAFIAAVGIVGNRQRAQGASIGSMLGGSGINLAVLEMPEGPQKYGMVIIQVILVLLGVFATSPPKPVEYEKTPTMVAAKEEIKEIKAEAKDTAIKEEIKDLSKELEPAPSKLPKTDSGVN